MCIKLRHTFLKSSLRNKTFEASITLQSSTSPLPPPPEFATIFDFVFIICFIFLMILSHTYVLENMLLSFACLKCYKNQSNKQKNS